MEPRGGRIEFDAPAAHGIEFDGQASNPFAESVDAGHKVDPRAQRVFAMAAALAALYAVALMLPDNLLDVYGNYHAPGSGADGGWLAYAVARFQKGLSDFMLLLTGQGAAEPGAGGGPASMAIRYLVIAMAGAGLAMTGAVYQGTFRNPLVAPSTLGVMSGATLGMALWVVFCISDDGDLFMPLSGGLYSEQAGASSPLAYLWGSASLALCAFAGCVAVVGAVLLAMRASKGMSPILLVIMGQVIGGVAGAVVATVRYYYVSVDPYGYKVELLTQIQIASFFREFGVIDIVALGVPLLATFAAVMALRQKMQLLSLDDAEARAMGVDSHRMRVAVVALCTLLTAVIVSFCGAVGYVGFLVPHLARRLVGPSFKYLFPASAVMGALFVLGAYELVFFLLGEDFAQFVGTFITVGGTAVFLATVLGGGGRSLGRFGK